MLSQDVVRRLTVIATDSGLTTLKTKLDAVDNAQDRVAASSARLGSASDEMQRRVAAYTAQASRYATSAANSALGGFAGRVGMDALNIVARFGPATIAAVGGWKLLNATIDQGTALLDKYSLAGQRAMFGSGVDEGLEKLNRFQTDKVSLEQIRYASELSGRLEEANRQIKEFFKVQLDLTDPALKLQNIWVLINEQIAKGVTLVGQQSDVLGRMGNAGWIKTLNDWMEKRGWTTLPEGAVKMENGQPVDGSRAPGAGGVDIEAALRLARGRLAAGLGGGFVGRFNQSIMDLANPPKPEKEAEEVRNAWTRALDSVSRQASIVESQVRAVGSGAGAQARFRVEAELTEAALRAKLDPTSKKVTDQIEKLSERAGVAAEKLAALRLNSDIGFEREQIGRNPIEATVVSRLRSVYGDNYGTQMDSATASAIRFNEQLKQMKDLTTEFVTGGAGDFRNQLRQGVGALEAAGNAGLNALTRLSDKLTDMALSNLVAKAFGGTGGGFNLFSLFGGSGDIYAQGSPGAIVPQVNAGIGHASMGGVVGMTNFPTKFINPAYFDDAPHMLNGGRITDGGVPIVAHPGERILNRDEARNYGKPITMQPRVVVNNYGGQVEQRTNDDGDLEVTFRAVARDEYASGRTNAINASKYGQRPRLRTRG